MARTTETPVMRRYREVKAECPGSLLLFRMGDFYDLFGEDARIAARVLGLTITTRDKNGPDPVPMAGFPYHALDGYLQKLIAQGHRVAVCEQHNGSTAYGKPTRVVTPGSLVD